MSSRVGQGTNSLAVQRERQRGPDEPSSADAEPPSEKGELPAGALEAVKLEDDLIRRDRWLSCLGHDG